MLAQPPAFQNRISYVSQSGSVAPGWDVHETLEALTSRGYDAVGVLNSQSRNEPRDTPNASAHTSR